MDIAKLLEETKLKQKQLVDQMNMLEQQKQQILQEVLKLEGEVRVLQKLTKEESNGKS